MKSSSVVSRLAAGSGIGLVAAFVSFSPMALTAAAPTPANLGARTLSELGIVHAFAGELARAESVFVVLLSTAPGDARALTNLGNIALLRDDASLALVFYDRAAAADTSDGGIRLNSAILLDLMGRESESQAEMQEGIRLAGSPNVAGALLGLRIRRNLPDDRGHPGSFPVSVVRDRLRRAIKSMTSDSTRSGMAAPTRDQPGPRRPSAAPRADEIGDVSALLYWKR